MSGITGKEFKAIRESLDLTQDQMAEILCLSSKQAVSNIETGFRNSGRLMSALMQAFVELPDRRSQELREILKSISAKQSAAARRRK